MKKIRVFAILFICFSLAFGQTTGKIAGRILDQDTGEPLAAVNIIASSADGGIMTGSSSDLEGNYFILNMQPGTYTLNISMIGYNKKLVQNVQVSVNRTTKIDVELKQGTIQGEEVVVVGKEITMKQDQTTSVRNVGADQLDVLPIESIGDAVGMQPGVVLGHFRGGRSSESVTMIDGISTSDGMGGDLIGVTDDAAQEVEVITGVFDAKYGHASTGITNIITKEGANKFHGDIKGSLGNYYTSHDDIFIGIKPSEVDRRKELRANVSGPIIKNKLFFNASTKIDNDKGPYNGINRFNVTDQPDYSHEAYNDAANWTSGVVGEGEYLLGTHSGNGDYVPMDWNVAQNYDAKLTFKQNTFKMNVHYIGDFNEGQGYSHARTYAPYGRARYHNQNNAVIGTVNHMLTNSIFYDLSAAMFNSYYGNFLYEDPYDSRYVHDKFTTGSEDTGFLTGGQDKGHFERTTQKYVGKLDLTWQVNNNHKLQTGFEVNQYDIDYNYHTIVNLYEQTDAKAFVYAPEILDDSTTSADVYNKKPMTARAYITDKMEYEDMVLSFGFGFEYFNPNSSYPSNLRDPNGEILGQTTEVDADAVLNIAPRLGFSYKLGDQALLKFSYGHTYNLPSFHDMYQNNSRVISPDDYASRIGMPNMQPQKNVKYQIGLWQKLSDILALEIDLWKENHYNYPTVGVVTTINQVKYGYYTNKDYGSARGLEVKLDSRIGNFMATAAYTLQFTRGNADNPTANFDREGNAQSPIAELIPLGWDQRHTFNLFASYKTEKYFLTLKGDFGSGSVYTWSPIDGNPVHRLYLFPNNSYKPYTYNVDLRGRYNITEVNGIKIYGEMYVSNLLDRLNENSVDGETGRANQQIVRDDLEAAHRSDFATYQERLDSPTVYSHPRRIKLTLGFEF